MFSRLLDPRAGHWSVRAADPLDVERRYRGDTLVVETTTRTRTGVLRLTDALLLGHGERGHRIGVGSPHVLVRHVEAVRGEVEVVVDLAPRFEYGLVVPYAEGTATEVTFTGGQATLRLRASHRVEIVEGGVRGRLVLREGESAVFSLAAGSSGAPENDSDQDAAALMADTGRGWQSWADQHRTYDGPYPDAVRRSSLVLQALTYAPTGAVVAAPTTSLPEVPGGT